MITTLTEQLTRVLTGMHRLRETKASKKEQARLVLEALEIIVDGTDPRIRLVSGYKRKLWQAVERSLAYTEQLVEGIPCPIDVGSGRFVSNQYLNAFFASPRDLETTLHQSSELMEFFEDARNRDAKES